MLLLSGRAFDYILEERQLARGQQRLQPFSMLACPSFFHTIARQRRLSPVLVALALLITKLLEEVLLGWGKVCCGSSCPTRTRPR